MYNEVQCNFCELHHKTKNHENNLFLCHIDRNFYGFLMLFFASKHLLKNLYNKKALCKLLLEKIVIFPSFCLLFDIVSVYELVIFAFRNLVLSKTVNNEGSLKTFLKNQEKVNVSKKFLNYSQSGPFLLKTCTFWLLNPHLCNSSGKDLGVGVIDCHSKLVHHKQK